MVKRPDEVPDDRILVQQVGQGWSYAQLASDDSPMLEHPFDSPKQITWKFITNKIEPFREAAPPWWFNFCLAAAVNDWPAASASPPKASVNAPPHPVD